MQTDAFTDFGDPELGTTDQFIPPFTGILEYKNVGFSFAGGGGFPFPIHPQIHYWGLRTYSLKTDEIVEITYHEHPLYGPWYLYLHPGNGRWKITRLVVTLAFTFARADWSKIPLASHPNAVTPDPARDFSYFDCLGPNQFYFENSEVLSNWPAEIQVTPYYP